jgi:hypothetical protein
MTRIACGVAILWGLAFGGTARAQAVYVPNQWEDRPNLEFAATVGLASFFDSGPVGARVGRRLTPWVDVEAGADRQQHGNIGPPYRMLTGAVRLSVPLEPRPRGPYSIFEGPASLFVTLGGARASGLPWRVSPMLGVGVQTPWAAGVVAFRFEYQRFTEGRVHHHDASRLMLSGVVGLKL